MMPKTLFLKPKYLIKKKNRKLLYLKLTKNVCHKTKPKSMIKSVKKCFHRSLRSGLFQKTHFSVSVNESFVICCVGMIFL